MLYEIRTYEATEGQGSAMRARFRDHVAPRLSRHGIDLVGAFVAPEEDGKLTYVTRFANEAARVAGWAAFGADPEWKAIKAASEVDGPLLAHQSVSVLTAFIPSLMLG